jgi:hypothetical protein
MSTSFDQNILLPGCLERQLAGYSGPHISHMGIPLSPRSHCRNQDQGLVRDVEIHPWTDDDGTKQGL